MSADENTLRREDARARRTAQSVFDRPLVLEAGAGTGKTATLIARLAAYSMGVGWDRAHAHLAKSQGRAPDDNAVASRVLSRMVLITFTEAAAAEMGVRATNAFAELAQGLHPVGFERDAVPALAGIDLCPRAKALCANAEQLFVGTIHAFGFRLLSRAPLEAGLHPTPRVDAEGLELEAVAREVVEDSLELYWGDGEPPLTAADPYLAARRDAALALARARVGPAEVAMGLRALLEAGAETDDFIRDPLADTEVMQLAGRVLAAAAPLARRFEPCTAGLKSAKRAFEVATDLCGLETVLARPPSTVPKLAATLAGLLDKKSRERLGTWAKGTFGAAELKALGPDGAAGVESAAGPLKGLLDHIAKLDPECLAAGRLLIEPMLGRARGLLRQRGVLAFGDLLRGARDLLRHDAVVLRQVRSGIDQLFVDEFQDTDPVQCDLVRAIALEGTLASRPGLFVVGDPKQSIYGWRQADLAAYEEFCHWVEDEGGEVLPLVVNRRSSTAVLAEVARALAPVMHADPGLQPAFQPLLRPLDGIPPEPAPPADTHAIEYWDTRPVGPDGLPLSKPPRRATVAAEARALAADIRARIDRVGGALRWRSFAVLLRSAASVEDYLEAFKRAGIPYAVSRERGYYRRREVIDASSLARAVLDPNDHLALAGWLRSPAVGVPDAALLALWRAGLPAALSAVEGTEPVALAAALRTVLRARDVAAAIDGPGQMLPRWHEVCADAVTALAELRQCGRELPSDQFVERLRARTLIEAVEGARFLGAFRVANLDRFFRELGNALEVSRGDPHEALRALRAGLEGRREGQEGRPLDVETDAVQILTIHKSKGLEFDCVYAADLGRVSRPRALGKARTEFTRGRLGPAYVLFGAATLDHDAVDQRRRAVDRAEALRLLYVATTRARGRLVLCAPWEELGNGPHLAEHFAHRVRVLADLPAQSRDPAQARFDAYGAAWRIVGGAVVPAVLSAAVDTDAKGAAANNLDAQTAARLVARARDAAVALAQRPRSSAISAAVHLSAEAIAVPRATASTPGPQRPSRDGAQAVGEALHRALERVDLANAREGWLEACATARAELKRDLSAVRQDQDRALARFDQVAQGLGESVLMQHMERIGPHVLARELPILLAADANATSGPVDLWSGAIDLVYRDPDTGQYVVVDHKSDFFADDADSAARICAYGIQVGRYQQALARALGPAAEVRAELWLLDRGEVLRLFDPT